MGAIFGNGMKKFTIAAVAATAAGLIAACGTSTVVPGRTAAPSTTAPVSVARLKAVAHGPEATKLWQDLAKLGRDGRNMNLAATTADITLVTADISAWGHAIRPIAVPPAYQALKARILRGVTLMSKGAAELGDGMRVVDMRIINKGSADLQQGTRMAKQAKAQVP